MPPNRVFLPDARGGDLYLRATWHADSATIVFSHWNGEVCMASTPVALTDSTKVIDLLVRALSEVAGRKPVGAAPAAPPERRGALDRLRHRLRPKLADVIDATTRFRSKAHHPRAASSDRE
ncbi:MAG: hypothetical protein ACLQRH_07145 [Acidimicrobiales bacterium]